MARPGNIGDDFVWSPAEGCRPAGQPLQLHSACVWPMPEVQAGADAVQIQLQISAQFSAVWCTPLAALHGNTDLGARGGWGRGEGVCGPRLFLSLLAAGCWLLAAGCSGRLRSRSSNGSALANREPSRISLVPIMQRGRDAANRLQPPCCCYCGKIP